MRLRIITLYTHVRGSRKVAMSCGMAFVAKSTYRIKVTMDIFGKL